MELLLQDDPSWMSIRSYLSGGGAGLHSDARHKHLPREAHKRCWWQVYVLSKGCPRSSGARRFSRVTRRAQFCHIKATCRSHNNKVSAGSIVGQCNGQRHVPMTILARPKPRLTCKATAFIRRSAERGSKHEWYISRLVQRSATPPFLNPERRTNSLASHPHLKVNFGYCSTSTTSP